MGQAINRSSFCFHTQNQKHTLRTAFQIGFVKHCGDKLAFWAYFFTGAKPKISDFIEIDFLTFAAIAYRLAF